MTRYWLPMILSLMLTGCAELLYDPGQPLNHHFRTFQLTAPDSPTAFLSCTDYDCNLPTQVSLTTDEWQSVRELFMPPAKTAKRERAQIAAAIGRLEKMVGLKNDTFADQPCNNHRTPVESIQLDCISESLNTTIYLLLLENQQLLAWHQVSHPTDRGPFTLNAPHSTAVIMQTDNQQLFAVDSWFHANGQAAEIVSLASWRAGYKPQNYCGAGQVTPLKRLQEEER